jgi:hypothetical protein
MPTGDAAARALFTKITDGTNVPAVKAGVSALPADNALTIVQSPNSFHRLATYRAVYKLAARPYALSNAFAAAGRKQFATLFHAATSTKKVKVRRILVAIESSSAASICVADVMRLTATTTPATGNPAITPSPHDTSDSAAEATALSLPTTAGTEGATLASMEWNLGITAAASTVNPPPPLTYQEVYSEDEMGQIGDTKPIILRAGVAEGIAVTIDCNAISTVKAYVIILFTEE